METLQIKPSETLDRLAKRYVWWDSAEWAYQHPSVFLSNVMNLGCWEDLQQLRQAIDDGTLKEVLRKAPPGYFHYRSWDYWHAKLGISPIPPLPVRKC